MSIKTLDLKWVDVNMCSNRLHHVVIIIDELLMSCACTCTCHAAFINFIT